MLIDVVGYYLHHVRTQINVGPTPPASPSVAPTRVIDTRNSGGPVKANTVASFQVGGVNGLPTYGAADTQAKAIIANVTVVAPKGPGNLRVFPHQDAGTTPPSASNINYIPGVDKAAGTIVQLPANGKIDVYSDGEDVDVIIDVMGWLNGPSGIAFGPAPTRVLDTRSAQGAASGPVSAGAEKSLSVGGQGGVPTTAESVFGTVTAVSPDPGVGNLRLYPGDVGKPAASTLNYIGRNDMSNFTAQRLPSSGQLKFASDGSSANVLYDVTAWYPAGS